MKTNLRQLVDTLVQMFNDHRGIIRSEVQHIIVLLSYNMNLKMFLLTMLGRVQRLKHQAKISALKTTLIVFLTHGKSKKNVGMFDQDKNLLPSLVTPLLELIVNKKRDDFVADMAQELLMLFSETHWTQIQEILIESLNEDDQQGNSLYNEFCDRMEVGQLAFLEDNGFPDRMNINIKLRIPFIEAK